VATVDLDSVRITLEYIQGDLKRLPAMRGVALHLKHALEELERAGGRSPDSRFERLVGLPEGRFLR
jgi:hypothetical protein